MAYSFQSIGEAFASVENKRARTLILYNPTITHIKWDVNKKIYVKKLLTYPKLYGIDGFLVI